jgi:hypothetical protein
VSAELTDRYPGVEGCRLDTGEDGGQTGPALDIGSVGRKHTIWVRESGTGVGKSVKIELSADNVRALRDGCTRMLVNAGVEEYVTISVPTTKPRRRKT